MPPKLSSVFPFCRAELLPESRSGEPGPNCQM